MNHIKFRLILRNKKKTTFVGHSFDCGIEDLEQTMKINQPCSVHFEKCPSTIKYSYDIN